RHVLKAKVKFFSTSICDDSFGFEGALDHVHWTMCAEMGMWTMGAGVWTMGEKELLSLLVQLSGLETDSAELGKQKE
ncbi:unnamed protein product, partial [Durusdinium trenchii]